MKIPKYCKVPLHYKFDHERQVCVPLTEDSTTEEKLHQYMGVWTWYEVPYEEEEPAYRDE